MEQTNQNQNQPFRCTGDCLTCRALTERKTQWQYCASQFTYNTMRMVETMQNALAEMQGTVSELKAKIDAIQNSEALVFAPDSDVPEGCIGGVSGVYRGCIDTKADTPTTIAQSGDGAEIDAPTQLNN